jgi:pimeloyl-ACP methyl ester carboxylesterase
MNERDFYHGHIQLHYLKNGSGNAIWLTFHGFGQDHVSFTPVVEILSEHNTVYSFDIFFHGKSHYKHKNPINKKEWTAAMEDFLDTHKIKKFSLAGFSIGCRLIIPLIEAFPSHVEKAVFIAPDGIKDNLWYKMATMPLFRDYFKYTIFRPKAFLLLLKIFDKYKMLDKSLIKLAINQTRERSQRWRIYKTWTNFRKLKVKSQLLGKILNENRIPSIMVLSSNDNIVGQKSLQTFIDSLNDCRIIVLDVPHHKLIEKSAKSLAIV